ncbi:MAG: carboxyl-terminal processing protease [Solirubrobacteraceae bacterium]|nr:carboxyl-terminal processing protease [Solirubrobacteraceae bacterium]
MGLVILLVGVWLGGHPSVLPGPLRGTFFQDNPNRLENQVLGSLTRNYYRPLNRSALIDKGLAAMVASLNDPYSHYFDPTDYRSFLNQSDPHLSGIGIDVLLDPHGLRVMDVFAGSPAARAGLARGDLIVRVGSTSLANRSASFGSRLIKGRAGTRVALTVQRNGAARMITVTRADIQVPVAAERMLSYKHIRIGYVELTSFTQGSGDEVKAQVKKALASHAQALILDLRENGGGLLQEGVNVASVFIPDGTIVSTRGRSQPTQVYVARGHAVAPTIPLVVLVDKGTASAAEIVTGALQDRGRAKVVGSHTYGKGVFQEISPLPNGGALDITVGEYFTPSGRNLGGGGVRQGAGITPNVYALDNPHTASDEALTVAERTVAAQVP